MLELAGNLYQIRLIAHGIIKKMYIFCRRFSPMPSTIKIEPHLSLDELEQGYRKAKQGIEKIHYQVIWLLAQGKRTSYVSKVTGYRLSWIYELVRSYNDSGVTMLGDQRRHNRGRKPLLNDQQLALLYQRLQSPPDDQGLGMVLKWQNG